MSTAADKFARLAALRPVQPQFIREERTSHEDSAGLDECTLAKLLGATIAATKYGNNLSIRIWYSTPEYPGVEYQLRMLKWFPYFVAAIVAPSSFASVHSSRDRKSTRLNSSHVS